MKTLRQAFTWLLISPAILPLIYIGAFLYPFTAPKMFLLWALGIVSLSLFVFLVSAGESFYWQRLKNKYVWMPLALLAVAYGASLIGVDFYRSFWSLWARGDGLLTLTVIVLYFYLIILAGEKAFFAKLCKAVGWVASAEALYATLEWVKVVTGINLPVVADTGARVGGTLDNAAFLACYLSVAFFLTLIAACESRGRWRTVLYCGAALQILAVLLTATRGSIVALGIALLSWLAYVGWGSAKDPASYRAYARYALIALVVVGGVFAAGRGELAKIPIGPVQRLASISTQDATVSSRLFVWQNVGALALEKPFTGYGAEHITELFDKVYDPSKIREEWFDRTHNEFLDYFVQFGVFGLLLYVGLIVRTALVGGKLAAQGDWRGRVLALLVGVYAIQNFFVFDTSSTLWLLFALFAAGEVMLADTPATSLRLPAGSKYAGALLQLAFLVLLWPAVIKPAIANVTLADAYVYHVDDVARSVADISLSVSLDTPGTLEAGYEAYTMYTAEQLTALQGDDLLKAYTQAESVLATNYDRFPYDARTATYLAHVLDSAPPSVAAPTDKLAVVLDHALALSPARQQLWYLKANIYIRQGDSAKSASAKKVAYDQAIALLEQYHQQVPAFAQTDYILASLYLVEGDAATAKTWADKGLGVYVPGNLQTAQAGVKYYLQIKDWVHAEQFLQDVVDSEPRDFNTIYDLAKVSYLAGDKTKAAALVAQLQKESPGVLDSDPSLVQALEQQQ